MSIFKAYDIRGIYPKELNEKIAFKIGKAFGTFNPGKIVVGSDARLSSPPLKNEFIKGLLSTGADVMDIGLSSTPMLIVSTKLLNCDGGVAITASHNPKEYNGFKFYDKNAIAISFDDGIKKIKEIFDKRKFSKGKGSVVKKDIMDEYINFLLKKAKIKKLVNLKIVTDTANGAAGPIYKKIFKKLGMSFFGLYMEPDGNFPNHDPDPSKKENLIDLQKKVLDTHADVGFAVDGDGDRLAVIDENGKIIEPYLIFSVLIENKLKENPKSKIIYEVLTSKSIDNTIRRNYGIPVVCRVGHTYISQKMIEEGAALGGELSGHYFFEETFGEDNALFAILKLIDYLSRTNKKISEVVKHYPKYFYESMRVPIKESEKISFIENLKNELKNEGYEIDFLDGVKIKFKGGWANLRPSNTESKISIAYEGFNEKSFVDIKKFVEDIIKKIPR